jgi:dihydrofolate reductase
VAGQPTIAKMTPDTFKLTIHMVSSLDGIIAKKDNSVSWFETASNYEKGVTLSEQEQADFLKTIDCYVMGSRTYELALELQNRMDGRTEKYQRL